MDDFVPTGTWHGEKCWFSAQMDEAQWRLALWWGGHKVGLTLHAPLPLRLRGGAGQGGHSTLGFAVCS